MHTFTAGWLQNRRFDLSLIAGTFLLALAVGSTGALHPELFRPLMLADIWLLGYHHVISTYTKLGGTAADRKLNSTLIWVWMPAMLFITLFMGVQIGAIAIVTVYFFWQWFHYVRQSWGIAQRYRRKAGGMPWDNERLAEITLWSIPVWGVLSRCHQQPGEFLFLPVWMPAVPLIVVNAAALVSLGLLAWWIVTRIRAWQRGELAMGHTLYMSTHFMAFYLGYVAIRDINAGWLLANVWHNSQYIIFVWLHNRQRFNGGVSTEAPRLSWLSQPGASRAALYFTACVGLSTAAYLSLHAVGEGISQMFIYGPSAFVVIVSMAINFHHYVVDGIIWKRRRDPAAPL